MKLYFAHSMEEYGTNREKKVLSYLADEFNIEYKIINPAKDLPSFKRMEDYLKYVREQADILVFMPKKNNWCGKGTYSEVKEAERKSIPIYIIKTNLTILPKRYKITLSKTYKFREFNIFDWKNYVKAN